MTWLTHTADMSENDLKKAFLNPAVRANYYAVRRCFRTSNEAFSAWCLATGVLEAENSKALNLLIAVQESVLCRVADNVPALLERLVEFKKIKELNGCRQARAASSQYRKFSSERPLGFPHEKAI